ncbi:hypothetical protein E2320_001310 [Naja naja]|nr:hypothetical protein E2320_001310 [Naja naja]
MSRKDVATPAKLSASSLSRLEDTKLVLFGAKASPPPVSLSTASGPSLSLLFLPPNPSYFDPKASNPEEQ